MKLDEDERNFVMKYAFSVANGNHILRYSEEEYRDYIIGNKEILADLFTLRFTQDNFGYDDERCFKDFDEQYLALRCVPDFKTDLKFEKEYFNCEKLLPWQKTVVEFTKQLIYFEIHGKLVIEKLLDTGSPLESIYGVLVNVLEYDEKTGIVLNSKDSILRAFEMVKKLRIPEYKPEIPFKNWEIEII